MKKGIALYVVIQLILIACAVFVLPHLNVPVNLIVFVAIIAGTICNLVFLLYVLRGHVKSR